VPLPKWTKGKLRLFITLEQKFDVLEQHERAHNDSKIGRDVGMP
jgi:hypothetical protein